MLHAEAEGVRNTQPGQKSDAAQRKIPGTAAGEKCREFKYQIDTGCRGCRGTGVFIPGRGHALLGEIPAQDRDRMLSAGQLPGLLQKMRVARVIGVVFTYDSQYGQGFLSFLQLRRTA